MQTPSIAAHLSDRRYALKYNPPEIAEWVAWLPTVPPAQRVARLDSAIRLRLLTDVQAHQIRRAMVALTLPTRSNPPVNAETTTSLEDREAFANRALITGTARMVLGDVGTLPGLWGLFEPHVVERLRVAPDGDVYVVDEKGNRRYGVTPRMFAEEIRAQYDVVPGRFFRPRR